MCGERARPLPPPPQPPAVQRPGRRRRRREGRGERGERGGGNALLVSRARVPAATPAERARPMRVRRSKIALKQMPGSARSIGAGLGASDWVRSSVACEGAFIALLCARKNGRTRDRSQAVLVAAVRQWSRHATTARAEGRGVQRSRALRLRNNATTGEVLSLCLSHLLHTRRPPSRAR